MQGNKEQEKLDKYRAILRKNHTVYGKVQDCSKENILDSRIESVLGPALNSFILWVLKEAERKQIKKLYFLARGMDILCIGVHSFTVKSGICQ